MSEIEKLYPVKFIDKKESFSRQALNQSKLNKINNILVQALHIEKPNFTQLQLALQENEPPSPDCYRILRQIMEKRFNLEGIP